MSQKKETKGFTMDRSEEKEKRKASEIDNNNNNNNNNVEHVLSHMEEMSPEVAEEAAAAMARRRRRRQAGSTSTFLDNTSKRYSWLLPGWHVEERRMVHGRLYKYYYDPYARMYYTRDDVIRAWEKHGLILLDK